MATMVADTLFQTSATVETNMQYGLLSYHNTFNLGDEIQSIAARSLLPRVDVLIDRDRLASVELDTPTKLICNGWFSHRPSEWPPAHAIRPLLTSVHINASSTFQGMSAVDFMLDEGLLDYLKAYGPVGARDLHTLELLEARKVPAYFSGCLTLTLPKVGMARQDDLVVLCDVPDAVVAHVRQHTSKIIQVVNTRGVAHERQARIGEAEARLRLLEQASCVITGRLHAALPCLALETPVFLVDVADDQYRFRGLHDLVRHGPPASLLADSVFDFNAPAPNSNDYKPLAQALRSVVHTFIEAPAEGTLPIDFQTSRINALTVNLAASARKVWELEGVVTRLEAQVRDNRVEAREAGLVVNTAQDGSSADLQTRRGSLESEKTDLERQLEEATALLAAATSRLTLAEQRAASDNERIEYLETEIARGTEELAQLRLVHSGLWLAYRDLQDQSEASRLELASLRGDLDWRNAEVERLRYDLSMRDQQLGGATGHIHALLNSSSWKITAPLRKPKELMLLRQAKRSGND